MVYIWLVDLCFLQTCLISLTCEGKWQSSASSRLFTDSERTSSVHSTSQRATFPAYRCVCISSCCTHSVYNLMCEWIIIYCNIISVFSEPPERGGDPAALPAASRPSCQRHRTRTAHGVVPPHGLQPLLPPHPPQRHTRLQHRHRSVTRCLKHVHLFLLMWHLKFYIWHLKI